MSDMGRPSKYKTEYAEQARKLCLLSATDREIANFFEVTESTLNLWKQQHPNFSESIKLGKAQADANVADRLYQRAMGFEHDSEEIKVVGGKVKRIRTRKIYAPDTTAAIFWLKNRRKDEWRDRQETDLTTNGQSLPSPLTPEQAEQVLQIRAKQRAANS